MPDVDLTLLVAFVAVTLLAQLVTSALVAWRFRHRRTRTGTEPRKLTILRPVCGDEHRLYETLSSAFDPDAAMEDLEVLFCAAREDDPAVDVVRRVIADHPGVDARLLIGDERVSANPKLNNLVKGWAAARHEWIAMIDSNVLLPRGYVAALFAAWRPGTGLVSAPAEGVDAQGLWASVEAAFLNGYQERWQLAADVLGLGFAQGKVLFWRRDILDAAGGPAALGHDLAEDVASTKLVRAAGLKVRLLPRAWPQPLGHRPEAAVWKRQVRWAQLRRAGFPAVFRAEPLTGPVLPAAALAALAAAGTVPLLTVPAMLATWYGAEALLSVAAGRHPDLRFWLAAVLRDLLLPLVWIAALAGGEIRWKGNDVRGGPGATPPSDPHHDLQSV